MGHFCDGQQGVWPNLGNCPLLQAAYILAGLAMMLNIRLSYSSAPYALIRFQLPENLFSVFVRRMASALELWCLPSMLLGNIIDLFQKLLSGGHQVRALKYAKDYDIQNDKHGSQLKDKANSLKQEAGYLYHHAKGLATARGTLAALNAQAGLLRDKAGSEDGSSGLHNAAQALVKTPSDTNATNVITAFEAVAIAYGALSEAPAFTGNKDNPAVKAVTTTYTNLKTVYDGILNLTKLKTKATALKDAATKAPTLQEPANQLATSVEALRDKDTDQAHGHAKSVRDKFNEVKDTFNSLGANKESVKNEFNALNTAYDNIGFCYKDVKFCAIIVPSIICQWLNFLTYVLLLVVYVMGGDQGNVTVFYLVIAISGVVFGINMTLVYSVDFYYIPVYIAGENSFPIVTSFIHYVSTLMFGNRRKWNSDFLLVEIDIWVAIIISFVAAVVWTYGYLCEGIDDIGQMKHIHAHGFAGKLDWEQISPFMMIVVGMGLVYAIYPGIAPGMIVPFYLIDKIEMVLLIATFFPPVIIAILRKLKQEYSPANFAMGQAHKWTQYDAGKFYLSLSILMVIKIFLAYIFIYSLHYRDSNLSRSIVNQPKMSTFLSITFYMCHEILLALGFSGFIGNEGGDYVLIPQYIGALFMIFLAFYSEGYIIEYKSHDPAHWPTEGMIK